MRNQESVRIFENDLLERLSRAHPVLNTATGVALAGLCAANVHFAELGLTRSLAIVAAGVFAWTLIEYMAHRHFFHWTPSNPKLAHALYLVHQYHHDYPNDLARSMFPLAVSLPTAFLVYLLLRVALPFDPALLAFATIVLSFTVYDVIHHLHHVPTRLMPTLRRRHMMHHFTDSTTNFGVTSSVWDRAFRTIR